MPLPTVHKHGKDGEGPLEDENSCMVVCDKFGKKAHYFESYVVPLWTKVYDSLVERARVRPGTSALDVGTGTGEVALRLSKVTGPKGKVVGIDVQPEMLSIAKRKALSRKAKNIQFKRMPAEELALPDDSFHSVLGNYSLCCFLGYDEALGEILRVLKPGGRLTYNHGGPSDAAALIRITEVFEKYKAKKPSEALRELRKADETLRRAVEKYRDSSTTLSLLRSLGYAEPEAQVVRRVIRYKDARAFVDRMVTFDWSAEMAEVPPAEIPRFVKEASEALSLLSRGPGFIYEDDMVFFTATKQ